MAAALHPIPDDWEEVPDDDTFSMVSAPGSEPDAVLITPAQTVPVSTSPARQQRPPVQALRDASPLSFSPSPSAPIGIPQCAALPVADIRPRGRLDLTSSSVPPTVGVAAPAAATDLPPPYEDMDTEASMVVDASGGHLEGQPNSRSVSPGWLDDAVAASQSDTGTGTDPSELLCQLAMVESARSEVARFTADELVPVRTRLGQQVLDVCARLGAQVADLHAVLSSYERAWDASGASICIDPALEDWLHCVRQLLVALRAEAESVALQSLDMDSDSRHEVTDCSIEELLQSFYVCLVDHSQKMDDFLPIMLSDHTEFISEQTAIFP